jgi:putative ABC transport system permease protein
MSARRFKPRLTKGLLVLQYSLSVFLIISSVIMIRQMDFVSQKDLGYNKDQLVGIPTYTGWNEKGTQLMQRYRNQLNGVPGVVNISGMAPALTKGSNRYGFKVDGEYKTSYIYYIDENFIKTMGMELVAGRDFSADRPSDKTESIIINQALAKSMGWEHPVGKLLPWKGKDNPSTVIGVVKDFNFQSLETPIEPMLLHMDPDQGGINNIMVRIGKGEIAQTLPRLKKVWSEVAEFTPFDYWFLDDAVAQQYASYKKWLQIMSVSTFIAILIACLGLFGLAGIAAINRTKEIGIRKVLGAGIRQIIVLLNKDIVKLILLSIVIAGPVSWYVMEKWLTDFAYRIDIGPDVFLISAMVALLVAFLTVSYHSVKAALVNPVDSLRNE